MDKALPLENNDNNEPEEFLVKGHMLKDRYEVMKVLGNGGFGVTYACQDTTLNLKVAVKEYYPDGFVTRDCKKSPEVTYTASSSAKPYIEKGMRRFLDEARVLARFAGEDGIVDVRDYFEENNTAYIVMEFLDGRDLKELIQEKGSLPAEYAVRLLIPVMESLEKIHRQGLIHRDISPDNIRMIGEKLKLLDFGAARDFSYEGNKTMTVMLKRGYAPIEQYGEVDKQGPWTDVYALCATLYLCITGRKPPDALVRWDDDPLQRPSQLGVAISPALENVIMKGLSLAARERYQSMRELVDALNIALRKSPVQTFDATVRIIPDSNRVEQPIERSESAERSQSIEVPVPEVQSWQPITPAPVENKNNKKKTKQLAPIIAVVLVFAILAGVFAFRDSIFGADTSDGNIVADTTKDTVAENNNFTNANGETQSNVMTESSMQTQTQEQTQTPTQTPSTPSGTEPIIKNVRVGDYITFGKYEQDNNSANGKEDIEWLVLDVKDGKALVISKYVLAWNSYNEKNEGVTWETCTLRKWLNSDFINSAFTSTEKVDIPTVSVSADINPSFSTDSGNATQDKIFLLSVSEVKKYFDSDAGRVCKPTKYAVASGAWENDPHGACPWWLRTPGERSSTACYVYSTNGYISESGNQVYYTVYGIRPAMWITIG